MIKEGDTVPNVNFATRTRVENNDQNPFDWKTLSSDDYFKNKRVVLFGLPGAFTPTCSSKHLPDYNRDYDYIKSLGIDEIYCLSVNDAFVMRQWGISLGLEEDKTIGSLGFKRVKLIPDGTVEFTRKMGLNCVWNTNRGFGERSWRYSCVINNGVIEKLFVEQPFIQNSDPDPFECSDSTTMINYLKTKEI
jgi:peroxiredoxin